MTIKNLKSRKKIYFFGTVAELREKLLKGELK